jgi:prepilin-type processing-associated H-X9-DG protein
MPALRTARERGRTANCAGNLKQMGAAFGVYTVSNDDWFPPTNWVNYKKNHDTEAPDGKEKYRWSWAWGLHHQGTMNNKTWKCPTAIATLSDVSGYLNRDLDSAYRTQIKAAEINVASWLYIAYAYSADFLGARTYQPPWNSSKYNSTGRYMPARANLMTKAGSCVAVVDSVNNYDTPNANIQSHGNHAFVNVDGASDGNVINDLHNKTTNMLYADGHVGNMKNARIELAELYNKEASRYLRWR